MPPNDYLYTKLKDLQVGDRFNVYGIITEIVKEKGWTKSGRLHSICKIKDESLPPNTFFRMHFFIPSHHSLDGLTSGNILRLHRVKVEEYQGEIDGRVLSGTDVVIFSSTPKDDTYHTEAKSITLTDSDKKRLEELREMLQIEKMFADDESPLLTVTDSQRIVFKDFEQPSSSGTHNKNKNRSNNDENDDGTEEGVEDPSEVNERFVSKVINPACANGKVVPNPFNSNFKRKRLSKTILSEEKKKKHEINGSTLSKQISNDALSSTVNPKKPFRPENCITISDMEPQKDTMEDAVTNNCQVALDKRLDVECEQSSSSYITHNLAQASCVKKTDLESVSAEDQCPGLACGGKNCSLEGIILLQNDDPLIANFDENDLVFDGLGDIPAADEEGNIISAESVLPFGDGSMAQETTVGDLLQFRWPRHRSKVKIVKIKPNIKYLNSKGPRNLLSGICLTCGRYSLYSQLKWKRGPQNKKPLCPFCIKDGKMVTVGIEFRIKLTVQDAWGTTLDVYAVKNHASKFLGCTAREYQEEERCRKRVLDLLSDALSSKAAFTITIFRMHTLIKSLFYVCETELQKALSGVDVSHS